PKSTKSYVQQLIDVLLPVGYPHSVTDDYIEYVLHALDSLQAFSSSIAGLLSSRAVLEGVGVGDATASPTAALLLNVLQESMGRIATILFAHRLGTSLEPECKMWRLAADVFNDISIVLDCLSPAFPKNIRVGVLGLSSVLRSLCGVCAGSSKASLSAHFAKRGNLGELNAKDSSQETVISLLGMLAGSVVVSWVSSPMATWTTLIALLSIHLATNYKAVRAVSMRSLNRQRANIVLSHIVEHGRVLRPSEVSPRERVFERDGVLRWAAAADNGRILGHACIGVTLNALLGRMDGQRQQRDGRRTGAREMKMRGMKLSDVLRIYDDDAYVLWFEQSEAVIVLKHGCTPIDQLRAWTQALLLARRARKRGDALRRKQSGDGDVDDGLVSSDGQQEQLTELRATLEETRTLFETYAEELNNAGWDLEIAALETRAGTRTTINLKNGS
ncbi:DUF647-domain-containing protein, partial [Aaosphaeria arxii CBS 175.79]